MQKTLREWVAESPKTKLDIAKQLGVSRVSLDKWIKLGHVVTETKNHICIEECEPRIIHEVQK
jgi:hypothetical protein